MRAMCRLRPNPCEPAHITLTLRRCDRRGLHVHLSADALGTTRLNLTKNGNGMDSGKALPHHSRVNGITRT